MLFTKSFYMDKLKSELFNLGLHARTHVQTYKHTCKKKIKPHTRISTLSHLLLWWTFWLFCPQKESVASFLRGHQRWAVQAFCINNKFIMHECGPLPRTDEWMLVGKTQCTGLPVKQGCNDTGSLNVQESAVIFRSLFIRDAHFSACFVCLYLKR